MSSKTALVEAAAELLWERGYAATSPAMVQKRAKAGQGSMYHHFSGKAELAVAAMRQSSQALRSAADEALASGGTVLERLAAYLETDRNPLAGCRMGRLVQDHGVTSDDDLREPAAAFFTWLAGRIGDVLTDGVRRGELLPDTDIRGTAELILATVQGGYVLARAQQDPEAFRRVTRAALRTVAAQSTKAQLPVPGGPDRPTA